MSLTMNMANEHYPTNNTMEPVDEIIYADRCECGRHFKNLQALQRHRNSFCEYTPAMSKETQAI